MYRLGYDFIVASEMSSLNTEYSTLFFKHSGIPEGRRHGLVFKVTYLILKGNILMLTFIYIECLRFLFISRSLPLMCVAPLGNDTLECLRYTDNVEKSVRNVISTSWPPGMKLIKDN